MHRILVTDGLHEKGLEVLRRDAQTTVVEGLSQADLLKVVEGFDALIVRSSTRVTQDVLRAGRRLRVVARAGAGLDNIDVTEACRLGIAVLSIPGANAVAVAELTMALLLALARHLPDACCSVKEGRWRLPAHTGFELRGKTLGIVGLGRIGKEVCARALAFGMQVLAHDPYVPKEECLAAGAVPASLEGLLSASQVITLHVPLNEETEGMIGSDALSLMQPGAILINCARGGVLDEDALYLALKNGHLTGAALDVFQREPPPASPLLELPNVLVTPHLGAATHEARRRCSEDIAIATIRVLNGEGLNDTARLHGGSDRRSLEATGD